MLCYEGAMETLVSACSELYAHDIHFAATYAGGTGDVTCGFTGNTLDHYCYLYF